jgi:hypothetical protein
MSILSTFLSAHLIPAIESELHSHAPEFQDEMLTELQSLNSILSNWLETKLSTK